MNEQSPDDEAKPDASGASSDAQATIAELRGVMRTFVAERNWQKFHAPKNLAMALAIEAAELMERFQWLDVAESRAIPPNSAEAEAIREEVADVFCYTLAIANELGFDLSQAFVRKMAKNRQKYPAEEYRGRYGKGDDRPVEPSAAGESGGAGA
ncbi:MAG TPA: nucleotide pyrophosphohydrolase [Pirellulaceae bacterium]|jgi:NTP pyrophosphatase (non-canonical NTP hydrolase)|nr:nucleotide pyrophosphohydrolase [Pirellulaceae bacterium]